MTKPVFNPEIIGELRKRVVAHNEIVAATHPAMQMKLGEVKKLYKRWFSGADPHAHALAMLDGKLLTMQTEALGTLEKARWRSTGDAAPARGRGVGSFSTLPVACGAAPPADRGEVAAVPSSRPDRWWGVPGAPHDDAPPQAHNHSSRTPLGVWPADRRASTSAADGALPRHRASWPAVAWWWLTA
jgi:hypothetical protein